MSIRQLITNIIEEDLSETNYFLVDVDVNQAETDLKFFIDGTEGVGIQICSRLSRKVSRILDEEYLDETPIRYQISSPGVSRPLVDKRQYVQHIGRDLEIECKDESLIVGELVKVTEDDLLISVNISKHKKEEQTILFENINNSKVQLSFKRKNK